MNISPEQVEAVQSGQPLHLTDPQTNTQFVILRADLYDRIKGLVFDDSEWTHDEMRELLARSAEANGWNEPGMEDYDRYDECRK